jgi:hypothetical protein
MSSIEDKIASLEMEVLSLKARLADDSKISELMRRIAACESLAGIQEAESNDDYHIKDEEDN